MTNAGASAVPDALPRVTSGADLWSTALAAETEYRAQGWDPTWTYDLGDHPCDLEPLHEQIHSTTTEERLQYEAAIRQALAAP